MEENVSGCFFSEHSVLRHEYSSVLTADRRRRR